MCEDTKEIQEHPETQRKLLDMRLIWARIEKRLEDLATRRDGNGKTPRHAR